MSEPSSETDTKSITEQPEAPAPSAEATAPATPDGEVKKRTGRRKITIEYIEDKSRRHITFSKRKAGIMKKAYELSTLTGTQVLLLVASETGHVYTFATTKLQPLITKPDGKNLIQACLNAPDTLQGHSQGAHGTQMSPPPTSYGQDMSMGMPQVEYPNQQSPAGHMYAPQVQDDRARSPMAMPYSIPRSYPPDVKPFANGAPPSEHGYSENKYSSPYASHSAPHMAHQDQPQGMMPPRGSYQPNTPTLPTLSDRSSFSNLPSGLPYNNQFHQPGGSNMPSYNGPQGMSPSGGGPLGFSSQPFPSSSSGQLFSNTPNLPAMPRPGEMPRSGENPTQ